MDDLMLLENTKTAYDMVFKSTVDFFCLKAAFDLNLFETMANGPQTLEELATATQSVPLRLDKFLTALKEIRLVCSEGGKWHLTELAEQFFADPEQHRNLTMAPFVEYLSTMIENYYLKIGDVVRGKLEFTSFIPWPPRTREDSVFYETLHRSNTHFPVKLLLESTDLSGAKQVTDVGGGIGDISAALCEKYPELKVTLLNLPSAIDLIKENVAARGLSGRIDPVVVDMYREPFPKADVVLISRILYPLPPHFCELMCQKAYDALEPGGKIILLDMNISDPHNPNYDYLTHYMSAIGTDFSPMIFKSHTIYPQVLEKVGFSKITFHEGYEQVLYQAEK
jgi:bacteriochlorophyll C20 methyltransferase